MSKLISTIRYDLKSPFRYTNKGELVEGASFVVIKAPTNKNLEDVSIIEQEYNKALLKAATMFSEMQDKIGEEAKNKKADKEDPNADASSTVMLMQSGGADMSKCYKALQRILVSGTNEDPTCYIDDVKERLTTGLFESMSPYDTKIILGLYIQNFFNMDA